MELRSFVLCNANGDEVCISNFGARILQWHTEVDGSERNIVLGYSSMSDYQQDPFYMGAIAGPFANRIKHGQCTIDDNEIKLDSNEGNHHLHGGRSALSVQFWQVEEQSEQALTLSFEQEDGYNGYPGPITFKVVYRLNDESTLIIDMYATSEKKTVIGPTSHPYFNLAGNDNDHQNHVLQITADQYTPVDEKNIPTGEIASVEDTAFDFRQPRILSERDVLDTNFVVGQPVDGGQAILISPDKKLQLHVKSDYPGIQVYTGDGLDGKFEPRSGICLEPQFFPNSPNQEDFPFTLTSADKPFQAQIRYQLVKPTQVVEENDATTNGKQDTSQPLSNDMDDEWQL